VTDYYDRDGSPMTLEEWAQSFGSRMEKKRVAEDTVRGYWISTVWLGLNHQWNPEGPPLIFETMVFPCQRDGSEPDMGDEKGCWRWSTEAQAQKGHDAIVMAARHGIPFDEIELVPEWEES